MAEMKPRSKGGFDVGAVFFLGEGDYCHFVVLSDLLAGAFPLALYL